MNSEPYKSKQRTWTMDLAGDPPPSLFGLSPSKYFF